MNTKVKKPLPAWLPFVIGGLLVLQFAGLSIWQISRGLEKREVREAFDETGSYSEFQGSTVPRSYQPIMASGNFDTEHQFLLDNIILNSRYGYYVLTPLEIAPDTPLLLVNRGWIEKDGVNPDRDLLADTIALATASTTVRGRVGSLPKPGVRMGEAIVAQTEWPQVAVFPTAEDLAVVLGRDVQPFVLLMAPEDEGGFLRHWVPPEMGPGKHFAYAFQWFAMGGVLGALLIWHGRKRAPRDD